MSEGAAPAQLAGTQIEIPALAPADPVLSVQREAVRTFAAAERARAAAQDAADTAHAVAMRGANDAAAFRRTAASQAFERVEKASHLSVQAAVERQHAALGKEVRAAVKQAYEARDRATPALESVRMSWPVEPEVVGAPDGRDAAVELREAVARTEAAVQPVLDAVAKLVEWRGTRAFLLRFAAVAAAVILAYWGLVRAIDHSRAGAQGSAAAVALSPDEERAAIAEIRQTVHGIDDASPWLERRYFTGNDGVSGSAYLQNGEVRRVVIRRAGWVTETYYRGGEVVFRYEHFPNPADPTDGLRYYYRAGVPVRLRRGTTNLVPGTVEYTKMAADDVRAAALEEMRNARGWSTSP